MLFKAAGLGRCCWVASFNVAPLFFSCVMNNISFPNGGSHVYSICFPNNCPYVYMFKPRKQNQTVHFFSHVT
ncbi:hypothetical protein VIGAN_05188400, partial [Vigna angularis var. angularis]